MESAEERPPPPGSEFAQRVAYVVIAVSAVFTIALVLFIVFVIYLFFTVESH
ncbi:MAG: hypothetical protein ABI658_30235 [Acidimicrobiales bacterium]